MTPETASPAFILPPFCTVGSDGLPDGPAPGTAESVALAAWEVLTNARLARSTGSGRMSLLGRYRGEDPHLSTDRVLWIALHAFEGADERWACRRARSPVMSDDDLAAAIVQEMGGPAEEPDEMTALGFWKDSVGFHFDCRGPCLEITELDTPAAGQRPKSRKRRMGRTAILRSARKILAIDAAATAPRRPSSHTHGGSDPTPAAEPDEQLSLL